MNPAPPLTLWAGLLLLCLGAWWPESATAQTTWTESFDYVAGGSGSESRREVGAFGWQSCWNSSGTLYPTSDDNSNTLGIVNDDGAEVASTNHGYFRDDHGKNNRNLFFINGTSINGFNFAPSSPLLVGFLQSVDFSVRNNPDPNGSPPNDALIALAVEVAGEWFRTPLIYGSPDGSTWQRHSVLQADLKTTLEKLEFTPGSLLDGLDGNGSGNRALTDNDEITGVGFYFYQPGPIRIDDLVISFAPVSVEAVDDTIEVGVGGALAFDPTANDLNSPDPASVVVVTPPAHGSAVFDPARNALVYKHTGGTAGTDTFTYNVSNGPTNDTATVTVTMSPNLRLANTTVEVPLAPPTAEVGTLVIENALPGLSFPYAVAMTPVPGTPEALLVASINGSVWYIPDTTAATPEKHEVMTIDESLSDASNDRSIISLTCYPDFATSGHLIVNYQGDKSRLPPVGTIPNLDLNGSTNNTIQNELRVSRFTLSAAHLADVVTNGMSESENTAVLATEYPFINMAEQNSIHTINDCKFGPDGYLYLSFGDEGGQPDPHRNGQTITKDYYSSLLRIDVDPASANPKPNPHYTIPAGPLSGGSFPAYTSTAQAPNFRIPADNPFIHTSLGGTWDGDVNGTDYSGVLNQVRTEIWAFGLRNPFKFHLDTVDGLPTGEVEAWIGDVGYDSREEFNLMTKGDNGGWSYSEGELTEIAAHAPIPGGSTPQHTPLWTYTTNGPLGNSATGGVFYRRTALPSLTDTYVCGDYGSGRIWSITRGGVATELTSLRLGGNDLVDFEFDEATDELFALEHGSSGRVMRITEETTPPPNYPLTLTETGIFADLTDLSPNPGVLPYTPNLRFWSDGADKSRWFVIKNLTDTIGYVSEGPWSFPEGMIWIKHFDFDLDRTNPGANVQRLETRLLVRTAAGSYGVSYRWRGDGSEADLALNAGEDFSIDFTDEGGQPQNFIWRIPSRAECATCHTSEAGHALSSNTRQFNLPHTIGGQTDNLLTLLGNAGYFTGFTDDPATLPRHHRPDETSVNLEDRVRSYLDVNCAYCHFPGSNTPASWDARAFLSTEATNMLYGVPLSEGAPNETDRIVIPGNKNESSIWNKINARTALNGTFNGHSQMPPLGSNRLDAEGIALLKIWIDHHANMAPSLPATLTIPEGQPIATAVTAALASDPDVRDGTSDQSQLTYAITGENSGGFFALHATTGAVTVTGWLDYERVTSHLMEVTVTDNFAPNPKTTVANVTIEVSDIIDEDLDGNRVPDTWESFFSLSGVPEGNDHDSDGKADFFEFLTGSDPHLPDAPPSNAVVTLDPTAPGGITYSWRHLHGMEVGTDYLLTGSDDLTNWPTLTEGVDYEVVSNDPDGVGYRRLTVRLLAPVPTPFFLRLSSP